MRIGVAGKGGSGKTSVSWMLMNCARAAGFTVFGLDADHNQHLAAMFGLGNAAIPPLADARTELVRHVMGSRTDITAAQFDKSTLPIEQSRRIELDKCDAFLGPFITPAAPELALLRVGDFSAEDSGLRCYHVRTATSDILLNHLAPLKDRTCLITDLTAGVDPFASGVPLQMDAMVLVVEPTLKSTQVLKQWRQLNDHSQTPLCIVGNKLGGPDELAWLEQAVAPAFIDAALSFDPAIARLERGDTIGWADLKPENRAALMALWSRMESAPRRHLAAARRTALAEIMERRVRARV